MAPITTRRQHRNLAIIIFLVVGAVTFFNGRFADVSVSNPWDIASAISPVRPTEKLVLLEAHMISKCPDSRVRLQGKRERKGLQAKTVCRMHCEN